MPLGNHFLTLPWGRLPAASSQLPCPIRLDLELLVLAQHVDEPLVGFMACGEAVGGCEAERHLSRWHIRVGIFTTDCQRPTKASQKWPSKIAQMAEVTSL